MAHLKPDAVRALDLLHKRDVSDAPDGPSWATTYAVHCAIEGPDARGLLADLQDLGLVERYLDNLWRITAAGRVARIDGVS